MAASISRCVSVRFSHRITFSRFNQTACLSTISKNKLEFAPDETDYDTANKYKKHAGVFAVKQVNLPPKLQTTISKIIDRYADSVPELPSLIDKMTNYLWSRRLPIEKRELVLKASQYEKEYLAEINDLALKSEDEMAKIENRVKNKVMKKLKQNTYKWEAMDYNPRSAFVYLASNFSAQYSVLYKIFNEIKKRDPDFKPLAFYDLGSGVGTGMWAMNSIWPGQTIEYYLVDVSDHMNTLARLILQDGEDNKEMGLKPVYFRQFAPASHQNKYNLVVSAFTLFEMPDKGTRIKAVMDLWKKTDDYLVLVENGTNAGFRLIREARKAIMKASDASKHLELSSLDKEYDVKYDGHVFAPCPHDDPCPWPVEGKTPCNFQSDSARPVWLGKHVGMKTSSKYSYVILRKGARRDEAESWPRIIRPVSTPSRHVHCRLCCPNAKLEHHIFTQRIHGKPLYRCARASKWGDLIPAKHTEATDHHSNDHLSSIPDNGIHGNDLHDDVISASTDGAAIGENVSEMTSSTRKEQLAEISEMNYRGSILVVPNTDERNLAVQPDIREKRHLTLNGTNIIRHKTSTGNLSDAAGNPSDAGCHRDNDDDDEKEDGVIVSPALSPIP